MSAEEEEVISDLEGIENSISLLASEKKSKKTDTPPKHYIVFDESDIITLDNATVKRFGLHNNKIPSKEAYETVTKILNTRNGKILGKILYVLTLDLRLRQLQLAREKAELVKAVAKAEKEKAKDKKAKTTETKNPPDDEVVVTTLNP